MLHKSKETKETAKKPDAKQEKVQNAGKEKLTQEEIDRLYPADPDMAAITRQVEADKRTRYEADRDARIRAERDAKLREDAKSGESGAEDQPQQHRPNHNHVVGKNGDVI